MTTYAEAHQLTPPAQLVRAPCCRRLQAADMILELPAGSAARAALGRWACDGCRAKLHRTGAGADVPGTR